MNKNFYRIIFNRQKGQLMVVSELANRNGCVATASSTPKTTSQSIIAKLKPLCLMVGMALGSVAIVEPAMAEIVADNNAAEHQQPQIIQPGANHPEIVNIQAADASGLSHNKYTQFDVDRKGAILNNSLQDSTTKLGGDISGNANLINGEAKIILNEVNSQNPSKLNGFIEVAGQKAQVIIANPSGIACDGCGFINADKATLTTGKPQIEEGQLKGYKVTDGKISITGRGLNTTKQDYTEIIARSVEVNANLRGNDIKIVTGRNDVSADLKTVTAIDDGNGEDNKPRLALDVSALGGMYAGKIQLVGTEKGVGVNNAGRLNATADGIVLKANGKIVNTGSIQAQNDIFLKSTHDIENTKQIYSKKNVKLLSQQKIVNEGSLFAQQGDIKVRAKDVVLNGKIAASQRVNVRANNLANLSNSDIKANALKVYSSQDIDVNSATLNVDEDITLKSKKTINSNNVVANTTKNYKAEAAYINNEGSTITAGNNIELTASDTLHNELSSLHAGSTLNLTGNTVNSDQANLEAGDGILVTSTLLSAKDATLISDNNINIDNAEKFDAENIRIDATGEVNIVSKGNVNAKNAYITNNKLEIQADQLELTNARIDAIDSINVDAAVINNAGATWNSKGKTTVHGDDINNTKAEINAADLELVAGDLNNQEAKLTTVNGGLLTIKSDFFDNSKATLTSAGDMYILGNTSIHNYRFNNSEATLTSQKRMLIESGNFNNTKAEITAADLAIQALKFDNREAKLTTLGGKGFDGSMTIFGNTLDNSKATLTSAGNMTITTSAIETESKTEQFDYISDVINNDEATLISKGEMRIESDRTYYGYMNNTNAKISAADLYLEANDINNQEAKLTTLGGENYEGIMTITSNKLDNSKATLTSEGKMTITSRGIETESKTEQVDYVSDVINNSEATLISKGEMLFNSIGGFGYINNTKAKINAAELDLAANHIDNVEAKLASLEKGMIIISKQVDNSKATLTSAGSMTIRIPEGDDTGTQLNNSEATLNSKGSMFLEAREINNTKAEISAAGMTIASWILNNQEAKITNLATNLEDYMEVIGEHQIDNSGATLISHNGIDMGGDNINNTKANIQAAYGIRITENKTLHNNEAVITADRIYILSDESVDNQQATITGNEVLIDTGTLNNTQSNIIAGHKIDIRANNINNDQTLIKSEDYLSISGKELINDGKLLAKDIAINVSNKLDNLKDILADNGLSIKTKQISNKGQLASKEKLVLKSNLIGNAATGEIDSQDVKIEGDSLINDGLINGDDVNIKLSGQFNNNDSARLYGDKINIIADELNNKASSLDVEKAPIIAAKNYLGIDVNTLNNYNHALLFSQGNMFINAGTLNNHSARIESHGDMDIIAGTLNNVNDKVIMEEVQLEDKYVTEFAPLNSSQRYDAEDVEVVVNPELKHWNLILKSKTGAFKDADRFNEYNYDLTAYKSQITSTAPAEIVAGNNLFVNASQINNIESSIMSGNEMSVAEEVLNNVSSQGTLREERNGTVTYHYPINKGLGEIVEGGSATSELNDVKETKIDFHNAIVEGHANVVKTEVAFVPHKIN